MIEYKLDKEPNRSANAHIRDMDKVLRGIAATYEALLKAIDQQESSLSSPSIDNFRKDLRSSVRQSIKQAEAIADNSAKLAIISEQASKHLEAIETRFSTVLKKRTVRATIK